MRAVLLAVALAMMLACATKEAEDPRSILAEDLSYNGVSGAGEGSDQPREGAKQSGGRADAPATRADCEKAARHLVRLGIDLAIAEERDPEQRRKLERERETALEGPGAKRHIDEWTRECLSRGTTAGEARCIATIRSERDIDRCVGPD